MTDATHELDTQIDRLVGLGYPALAGLDEAAFRAVVEPLARVRRHPAERRPPRGGRRLVPPRRHPRRRTPRGRRAAALAGRGQGRRGRRRPEPRRGGPRAPTTPCRSWTCREASAYLLSTWTGARSSAASAPWTPLPPPRAWSHPADHRRGGGDGPPAPALLGRTSASCCWAPGGGDRRVPAMWISERRAEASAGAGTATRTPGSAPPPRRERKA